MSPVQDPGAKAGMRNNPRHTKDKKEEGWWLAFKKRRDEPHVPLLPIALARDGKHVRQVSFDVVNKDF